MLRLATLAALAGCGRGGRHAGVPPPTVTTLGALVADPARNWLYVADGPAGRLLAVTPSGSTAFDVSSVGGTIGGIAQDPCFELCYISVTSARRIDVFDPDTSNRLSTIRVGKAPLALAPSSGGRLLVVSDGGLEELDPATLLATPLLGSIDPEALVCSDRELRHAYVAESTPDGVTIRRYDLANLGAPPLVTPTGAILGRLSGLAIDYFDTRLCVSSDVAPGITILDAATLLPAGTIDTGGGVAAIALNTTGTRLYWSDGSALVSSATLDALDRGDDLLADAPVRPRGLAMATTNNELALCGTDGTIETRSLNPFVIRASAALKQGEHATMTIDGTPDAQWLLFTSSEPGFLWLDPSMDPDARLFELSLTGGFVLAAGGILDAEGHAEYSDDVPAAPAPFDTVWQAVELPPGGPFRYELSNAIVVRVLGPGCQ